MLNTMSQGAPQPFTIRIVSLTQSPRRATFTERAQTTLDWDFLDAHTTNTTGLPYDSRKSQIIYGRPLRPGEQGCFASHYALWRLCVQTNQPLIALEDDVDPDWAFLEALARDYSAYARFEFLRFRSTFETKRVTVDSILDRQVVELLGYPRGTQGYLITPRHAKRLLKRIRLLARPVDDEMDRVWRYGAPNLMVDPSPITPREEPSEIGEADRTGHIQTGVQRKTVRIVEKLRKETYVATRLLRSYLPRRRPDYAAQQTSRRAASHEAVAAMASPPHRAAAHGQVGADAANTNTQGAAQPFSIRVISLPHSPRRAEFAERVKTRLEWEFFDAHTSNTTGLPYDGSKAQLIYGRPLKPSELGCYGSHYALWRLCADSDQPLVVFEDDVDPDWRFLEAFARDYPSYAQIEYLRFRATFETRRVTVGEVCDRKLVELLGYPRGAQGYVLTPAHAKRLLTRIRLLARPVDDEMDRVWRYGAPNLVLDPPALSDRSAPSEIGEDRTGHIQTGVRRKTVRIIEKLRKETWVASRLLRLHLFQRRTSA